MLKNIRFTWFRQDFIILPTLLLLLSYLFLFASICQAKDSFPSSTVLAPGDTVRITFKQHSFLTSLAGTYTVNPEGKISMRTIGTVRMAGGTVSTREKNIRKALQKIISIEPEVKLTLVGQYRFVLMARGVRYPGWYKVPLRPTIEELATIASGAGAGADLSTAKISRIVSGKNKTIPLKKALPLQSFDHLALDINTTSEMVDSGDLLYIVVPKETTPAENAPREMIFFMDEVKVDRYGYIFLSSQGSIKVAGRTTKEIKKILTTSSKNWLSWFTEAGLMKRVLIGIIAILRQNVTITFFYR